MNPDSSATTSARSGALTPAMAALGLGLHFLIAIGAAAVFYLFSRRFRFLTDLRFVVLTGLVYGALVFLAMNLVVLPASMTPPKAFPPRGWMSLLTAHLLCVGLPIAVIVAWFSRRPRLVTAAA